MTGAEAAPQPRIRPENVRSAVRKTKMRLVRHSNGDYLTCGCPIAVVLKAKELLSQEDLDARRMFRIAEQHYGSEYISGFLLAIDNPECTIDSDHQAATRPDAAAMELGIADGLSVLRECFRYDSAMPQGIIRR